MQQEDIDASEGKDVAQDVILSEAVPAQQLRDDKTGSMETGISEAEQIGDGVGNGGVRKGCHLSNRLEEGSVTSSDIDQSCAATETQSSHQLKEEGLGISIKDKEHGRSSKDSPKHERSELQPRRDSNSAADRGRQENKDSKSRSSQHRHEDSVRERYDRQLSPSQRKSLDKDKTHRAAFPHGKSHASIQSKVENDVAIEAAAQQSDLPSKGSNLSLTHSKSSPKAAQHGKHDRDERLNAEKVTASHQDAGKKRSREKEPDDAPARSHIRTNNQDLHSRWASHHRSDASKSHHHSFAPGENQRRGWDHPNEARRPGRDNSSHMGSLGSDNHARDRLSDSAHGGHAGGSRWDRGDTGPGGDNRKRHHQQHRQPSREHDAGRERGPGSRGADAIHPKEATAAGAEGQRPPGGEQQGGWGEQTGTAAKAKEKKAPKVQLSFDEELDEEEKSVTGTSFNLAASTASRFEQERQRSHSRVPAPPAAAPCLAANNLRMQVDDGEQFGAAGLRPGNSAPPSCLGRMFIGVAQAKVARPYMEDRHTIVASYMPCSSSGTAVDDGIHRCFAAVYDGHNGCHAADMAASRLHLMIASDPALRMYSGSTGPPSLVAQEEQAITGALRRAFREIDDDILRIARAESLRDGSTALLVMRLGQVLYAAHAGDSRAVLCRGGMAERLTEDHKPNLPVEKHRIQNIGGRVEFQRCWRVIVEPREGRPGSALAVSRSLGDLDFKEPHRLVECEPDVTRTLLQSTDSFVVLASDGLWDMLSDQDAVDCARAAIEAHSKSTGKGPSDALAAVAADALLQEAVRRGTLDNTTVIVLLLQWD